MGIQDDLVNGIYDVYTVLREEDITYYPFDTTTVPNVYGETGNKKYLTPVKLLGKVKYTLFESTETVHGDYYMAVITIPKKSFDLVGINIGIDTIDFIKNGKFSYQGIDYQIDRAEFGSNLKSVTTKYKFTCRRLPDA